MKSRRAGLLSGVLACALSLSTLFVGVHAGSAQAGPAGLAGYRAPIYHVVLISVDGLHALDLTRYVRLHPFSNLAMLTRTGVTYTQASTMKPSDSFPGLLAQLTGGSPRSTGVWYDNSYDRRLSPPGSRCATIGTNVLYDESIDRNVNAIDGGGIDPKMLPLDPARGCTPVYPHSYLRVNTIFDVIKAAGGRTAWADKHPAYDLVNGPSGHGVDDLYTPEVAVDDTTGSVVRTEANDELKVRAVLNEIDGRDHTGTRIVGVPTILGMNFQAVSVGEKLASGGYVDSQGTPSASLLDALTYVDNALGRVAGALRARGLLSTTLIIVSAKHGQTPMDRGKKMIIDDGTIPGLIKTLGSNVLAQATQDDVALLWLRDQSKTAAVVALLSAHQKAAGIREILSGDALRLRFDDPRSDSRTPDIIVLPDEGVIYAGAKSKKIAEHGGFNEQDTNVPILVSNPILLQRTITFPVQTTQIAPTILRVLGLDPRALQAVRMEETPVLPGLGL